jgi:hypothetical protein
MTEKEYRAVPTNSSSSIKEYSVDKRKYRKRYVAKEHVEDKDSIAATMGRLVETLLMEPERFDDMFYMSACATLPGAVMLSFVDALVAVTLTHTDEITGEVTLPFLDMATIAYSNSECKQKIETVLKNFDGTDAEIYYEELVKVKFNNLTVVTPMDVNNAERVVAELKTNPITATIVNLKSGDRFTVTNQLKVTDFKIDGMPMKSMLDKVIVDNVAKTIQFYDLKCTWNVEQFYKEYYLYRRAYIQGYTYFKACQAMTLSIDSVLAGYTVLLPKFIVCDSINYYSPLIYEMTEADMKDAYHGFERRGYYYPGVKQIIEELNWSIENDKWNISKYNFENNGLVKLTY